MTKIVVVDESEEEIVEGTITARVKGGLLVTTADGVVAFLPASQVDLRPVRDLESTIGEQHRFKVIKFRRSGGMVLSRRVLLERQRADLKREALEKIKKGQTVEGIVRTITRWGAVIDVEGIDGLLRFSDGSPPSIQVGDRLWLIVLEIDFATERIDLGRAPWADGGPHDER
jgi:small subunit ribosomal protein S1